MNCATCRRLTEEYNQIGRQYAAALSSLSGAEEKGLETKESKLYRAASEARLKLEVTRHSLEKHKRCHSLVN